MKNLRQSTVEPVFGSLINFYAMSRVSTWGIDLAHKNMVMAAIAYYIKKYMKYQSRITNLMRDSVKIPCNKLRNESYNALLSIMRGLIVIRINNLSFL